MFPHSFLLFLVMPQTNLDEQDRAKLAQGKVPLSIHTGGVQSSSAE